VSARAEKPRGVFSASLEWCGVVYVCLLVPVVPVRHCMVSPALSLRCVGLAGACCSADGTSHTVSTAILHVADRPMQRREARDECHYVTAFAFHR